MASTRTSEMTVRIRTDFALYLNIILAIGFAHGPLSSAVGRAVSTCQEYKLGNVKAIGECAGSIVQLAAAVAATALISLKAAAILLDLAGSGGAIWNPMETSGHTTVRTALLMHVLTAVFEAIDLS
ncbi:hypothetical protein BDZ85DRAFT_279409 [Elsinoe ampelina]|uniref:Uncharacterized protein n=1 Tax=Elsinoe ampelina TaxID=302913 RepID=A0A6A6GJD7_9PEZI|nr:hypothetical protein BDZ85DRAFT_279409 [Elsinoe ampelina]